MGALAHVRAPRTTLRRKSEFSDDLRFPLLLRAPGFHTGQHFVKVEQREDVVRALAELPGDEVLAIEYLEARGGDGRARKYRVPVSHRRGTLSPAPGGFHRIGRSIISPPTWASRKRIAAKSGISWSIWMKPWEPRRSARWRVIAGALGLEYGGIDFAVGRGRRIAVLRGQRHHGDRAAARRSPMGLSPRGDRPRPGCRQGVAAGQDSPAPMAMCG